MSRNYSNYFNEHVITAFRSPHPVPCRRVSPWPPICQSRRTRGRAVRGDSTSARGDSSDCQTRPNDRPRGRAPMHVAKCSVYISTCFNVFFSLSKTNLVRIDDRIQTMRDREHGAVGERRAQRALDEGVRSADIRSRIEPSTSKLPTQSREHFDHGLSSHCTTYYH